MANNYIDDVIRNNVVKVELPRTTMDQMWNSIVASDLDDRWARKTTRQWNRRVYSFASAIALICILAVGSWVAYGKITSNAKSSRTPAVTQLPSKILHLGSNYPDIPGAKEAAVKVPFAIEYPTYRLTGYNPVRVYAMPPGQKFPSVPNYWGVTIEYALNQNHRYTVRETNAPLHPFAHSSRTKINGMTAWIASGGTVPLVQIENNNIQFIISGNGVSVGQLEQLAAYISSVEVYGESSLLKSVHFTPVIPTQVPPGYGPFSEYVSTLSDGQAVSFSAVGKKQGQGIVIQEVPVQGRQFPISPERDGPVTHEKIAGIPVTIVHFPPTKAAQYWFIYNGVFFQIVINNNSDKSMHTVIQGLVQPKK